MNDFNILIIDDEESQRISLKSYFERRGYKIFVANNGLQGYDIIKNNFIDLVLTDLRMPEWDGLKFLQEVKKLNPEIEVIVNSAYGNIEDAVQIMKQGAYDYLTKPIDLDLLDVIINRIKERRLLIEENRLLKEKIEKKLTRHQIISKNIKIEEALNIAARVADTKATVLIRGESGTGKELYARAIHFGGNRNQNPFLTVNVAALSENLLESELFGHEKGAFTGAHDRRIGRFEEADTGTIFIDEVGDIPLHLQVKLLRAIQFGEIQRLGSNKSINVDVRIIAATNKDLESMIKNGEFREDLYYRFNVISVVLPPLRERKDDIPVLIQHFIEKFNLLYSKNVETVENSALDILLKYNFPGNVRELENIMERAVIFARTNIIKIQDLPGLNDNEKDKNNFDDLTLGDYHSMMENFEKSIIIKSLTESNGNQSAAARILGISERHLRSRMNILAIKNQKT